MTFFFKGSDSTQQYNPTVVSSKNVSLRGISCDNVKIQKQIPFAEGSALCVWWSDSHLELITMLPMWADSIEIVGLFLVSGLWTAGIVL